ncbi:MAG: threonine/serine exporter family protein [Pirellulales bacterium]|nr:threonine/serine exporter family protein [Pirellulales bacterium]
MTPERSAPPATDTLLEFLYRLAQAYLASGEQTAQVELLLRRVATAYGIRRARIIAFPTAIFIIVQDGDQERVTLAEGPTQSLRLDQIAHVYTLGQAAQKAEVTPQAGLERLTEIQRLPARYGELGILAGHVILTFGMAMVLMPSSTNLAAAIALGAIVGALKILNRNRPLLAVPLPVVAAALVSALVFLAIQYGLPLEPRHALIAPLVSFLPGGMLTLGMVELAYGDMVSGSSRLVTGFVQLLLLVFGLAAGATLVGYSPENLTDTAVTTLSPLWLAVSPWLGVVIFGLGAFYHFSAPKNSLLWMLFTLLVVYAVQQGAEQFFSERASGFFAMLVVTPLGYLIQLRFRGPPAMVTFLPSFWLVVPGALGLLSVTQMLSDRAAGTEGLINALFALTSIALGTLLGASMYKWLTEKFGWWQLQLGRVGGYFRRKGKR